MSAGRAFFHFGWRCPAALLAPFVVVACAERGAPASAPSTSAASDGGSATSSASAAPGAAAQRPATAGAPPALPGAPSAPLPGGELPTPDKALPELRVEPLGMHVGGGKNDIEEKAPFQRALERQFPAFLDCYRLSESPMAGGSFGVDIKIPRAGGKPVVEQPRTRIRGEGFQACMVGAVERTQFERPKGGPTVISYSVRFTLGKAKN